MACLHQASASMLQQCCDDTTDTVLIESNGVAPDWSCKPFWSDFIVFNENSISLGPSRSCRSIDSDARCKRTLNWKKTNYVFSKIDSSIRLCASLVPQLVIRDGISIPLVSRDGLIRTETDCITLRNYVTLWAA